MLKKAFKLHSFFCLFCAIVSALFLLSSCETRKTIVNNLEEKDANEILVFLASKNIDAIKVPKVETGGGGAKVARFDIQVESTQATEAMAYLNAAGLPRRVGQSLLELFHAGGLVPSAMQDRIRYQAGLAEQIAHTIRKIDGVLDADVQLSFPEEDPLNPTAEKGKVVASVYVKHSGILDDPNSQLISKIKRFVASSVNGLDYDNVNVVGDRARFSETPVQSSEAIKEKFDYVKVWTIVVAKTSLTRFQILFFTFTVLILLLLLSCIWLFYKIFPIAKKRGGVNVIFHLSPIPDTFEPEKKEEKKEPKKEEEKPKAEKGPPPPPPVQENVESP
jgi:type III secretion protein J